jgi:hypothetical protein
VGITGGVMGVAEAGEGVGLAEAVADLPVQVEGLLVARDGLALVAEVMVGIAEAVPGLGLTVAVAELPEQVEGLLAVD